jgi:uncharacterized protein
MAASSPGASWSEDWLQRLTAASGVGYVATAYTASRWLTRRAPGIPIPPVLPGVAFEALACRTEDGLALHGWAFTPPEPHGTVALFHGVRYHRGQTLDRVAFLTGAGYRCVAFDHRAHGASEGRCTSFGYHERLDVQAVTELIGRHWPDRPVAALGISMGAAAVCFAGPALPLYRAFILESVYHDLADAFRHRVGGDFPGWFQRFRRGIIWVTERRLGVRIEQVAPAEHVRGLAPRPVLLVTGSDDPHAPPADVRRLYERCAEPREIAIISGAAHTDVCAKGGERYRELVLSFLRRNL